MTRLRGRLDHLLRPHVHRGLDSLRPLVLETLRLGAYQLLYMDSVPEYAAVSESVEQVGESVGAGPKGLVNAVLRRIAGAGDPPERFPSPEHDLLAYLTTWGSHPSWLVERWLSHWSEPEVRRLVEWNNQRPRLCVAPLDEAPAEAAERLGCSGIEAEPVGGGSSCLRCAPGTSPLAVLEVLPHAVVQDPGANLVVRYADVPAGTKVADLCAAPGGKVLAVAGGSVYTLAADRSETRIRMVRENARRVERNLGLVVADARMPPLASAEVVLLDVPCTGTGTLGRHPDARWRLRPSSVGEMVALQDEMLDAAAELVPAGGLLVYSTCSLEPEENEERIESFLERHGGFRVEPTGAVPAALVDERGCLRVTPQESGFDGSFAARMRRVA